MRSINKQPKKPGYIFSVFKGNEFDMARHENVLNILQNNEVAHKVVNGRYKHDNDKIVNELSFYVETNDNYNKEELHNFVRTLCTDTNQESFLELDVDRQASLIPLNGRRSSIGVFTQVSELEAINEDAYYTYCPLTESYFVCK